MSLGLWVVAPYLGIYHDGAVIGVGAACAFALPPFIYVTKSNSGAFFMSFAAGALSCLVLVMCDPFIYMPLQIFIIVATTFATGGIVTWLIKFQDNRDWGDNWSERLGEGGGGRPHQGSRRNRYEDPEDDGGFEVGSR